ncbi:F-box/kelch-repeat protein At3g23880-like [Vicia villosa]|uniref:F-box/kelch-repeat protein At3g23880-like n=1 Tax=Vicia villosa TaxID=3911 RepID=UPI00273B50FF|nr:F-box/kelch-repeat protein At3g23880-like [Vicia villosa]
MGSSFLLKIFNCWDFLQLEHPPKPPLSPRPTHKAPVYFPSEHVDGVLSFLPVKSVIRFRCVSKTLNSLISDPSFVKLHLNRSAQNEYTSNLYTSGKGIPSPPSHFSRRRESIPITYKFPEDPSYKLKDTDYIVGFCNGLLCLYGHCLNHDDTISETWLRIWNPATRTISEKLSRSGKVYSPTNLKFGYDNSTNTYKVLYFCPGKKKVRVLTLGNNVWRKIQNFPVNHDFSLDLVDMRGRVVWLAIHNHFLSIYDCKSITIEQFVIISLDLSTETHIQLRPPCGLNEVPIVVPKLSVLNDCLCFAHDFKQTHFVLWQMKEFGVEESWSQFFKICYQDILEDYDFNNESNFRLSPLYYSEKDDALFLMNYHKQQAIIYSRRYNRVESKKRLWLLDRPYVESLVWYC